MVTEGSLRPWHNETRGETSPLQASPGSGLFLSGAATYRINPANRGSARLISGMQMISSSPTNSASI